MKTRSFILRALLFALVLAPAAMPVSAKPAGALSCRVANLQLRAIDADGQAGGILDQFVASTQRHRAPAPRLHRIHGKKISVQAALVLAPRSCTLTDILVPDAHVDQQDMDGPNPSRGPPSPLSL
jgi:hypothetical protein